MRTLGVGWVWPIVALAEIAFIAGASYAKEVDCLAAFQGPIPNYPPAPKAPTEARCIDGDPACDTDGLPNGVCQFSLSVCVNVPQQGCSSPGVASYTLKNKLPGKRGHNPFVQSLQDAVSRLNLPQSTVVCSDVQTIVVPVKGPTLNGFVRRGKATMLVGNAAGVGGGTDHDTLKLRCEPASLPPGCRETTVRKLLGTLSHAPAAEAAFYDSWRLATELGLGPKLTAVTACDLPAGQTSYTAAFAGGGELAAIAVILQPAQQGGWAPLLTAPAAGALKLFDRHGGFLLEGADTQNPTVGELDADGNVVGSPAPLAGRTSFASAASATCQSYLIQCLYDAVGPALNENYNAAVPGKENVLCVAFDNLKTQFPLLNYPAGLCTASGTVKLVETYPMIVLHLALATTCLQKVTNGDYRCEDYYRPADNYGSICSAYGACARDSSGLLACRGVGDRCQFISQKLVCSPTPDPPGFTCGGRCGDGILNPSTGEQCDPAPGANIGGPCVISNINAAPGLGNCARATCGDGFLCADGACTSGPNGGPEECDPLYQAPPVGYACTRCKLETVCGDSIVVGNEKCDGTSDSACPGQCIPSGQPNECECPSICQTDVDCFKNDPDGDCYARQCVGGPSADPDGCAATGSRNPEPVGSGCDDGIACTGGDSCVHDVFFGIVCRGQSDICPQQNEDADCYGRSCNPDAPDADAMGCASNRNPEPFGSSCAGGTCQYHSFYGIYCVPS